MVSNLYNLMAVYCWAVRFRCCWKQWNLSGRIYAQIVLAVLQCWSSTLTQWWCCLRCRYAMELARWNTCHVHELACLEELVSVPRCGHEVCCNVDYNWTVVQWKLRPEIRLRLQSGKTLVLKIGNVHFYIYIDALTCYISVLQQSVCMHMC